MGMSEFYGDTEETEFLATLELALELGVTMFDTADVHSMGENERFLAPFIQANRDRAVIATKFGYARTPERPTTGASTIARNSFAARLRTRSSASVSRRSSIFTLTASIILEAPCL